MRTYEVDGSWVIADDGGWCAGAYDTEATARYAHRAGAVVMELAWHLWQKDHPEVPSPIMTRRDVQAYQRILTETEP